MTSSSGDRLVQNLTAVSAEHPTGSMLSVSEAPRAYDLAIVGSGGAAFAAAISARERGASVVMVERGTVGGTCVNTGCVPSKALLAAAEGRHVAPTADRFPGIRATADGVAFSELIAGKDALVETMRADWTRWPRWTGSPSSPSTTWSTAPATARSASPTRSRRSPPPTG